MEKTSYQPKEEKTVNHRIEDTWSVKKGLTKKPLSGWTKEELIAEIKKLKERKKYGLVWEQGEGKISV